MQDINDDQDLQIMASRVVILVAQLSYPPAMVPLMVDKFVEMLTVSSSWHVRVKALPVLQVFFFKHLFLMETKVVMRVVEVVSGMLLDNQIEVTYLSISCAFPLSLRLLLTCVMVVLLLLHSGSATRRSDIIGADPMLAARSHHIAEGTLP